MRPRALAALLFAALALSASAASALDPSRAEADAKGVRGLGNDAFCRAPARPLSMRARALCPHASQVPDCQGFVEACAEPASNDTVKDPEAGTPTKKEERKKLEIPAFLGDLARFFVWILVAAVVVAILVPIGLALARMRRDKKAAEASPVDEAKGAPSEAASALETISDAELLLRKADERARVGQLDLALHLYLGAALRALDHRGAIRIARDRTNGEYVRGCKDAAAKGPLREIVREVDRVQFGGEAASEAAVTRAKSRAVALVRVLPTALLALAMVLALGACDSGEPKAPAWSNPAGDEMMGALLDRQGVPVKRLGSPIASLKLVTPAERGPVVVVDLDRTTLDDDARAHLMAWVDSGGVLVLAARPQEWPYELRAKATTVSTPGDVAVLTRMLPIFDDEDDDEDDPAYITRAHASVAAPAALVWPSPAEATAKHASGAMYAGLMRKGKGAVLGVASDELFTNVGLARPGNAEAFVALMANLDPKEVRVASPEDGTSPPTDPLGAMIRAGLGLAMLQALAFAVILFVAVGARLARPRPALPPRRRAFTEHLEATGALYARAKMATFALAAYARYAEERLHARMPRGMTDVPQFLAQRAGADLASCQRVWMRASNTRAGDPPRGDELSLLKELSALFSAAVR